MKTNLYKKNIHWFTLGALVLGILFGLLLPGFPEKIAFIGDIYIGLLKLVVVPLLICQIFTAAARRGIKTGKTLVKTVLLFFVLFAVTFVITYIVVSLIRPGNAFHLPEEAWDGTVADTTAGSIVSNLFCWNIFEAMSAGKILPCVLFSLVCGIAASLLHLEKTVDVAEELSKIFIVVLDWIMYLTPLGVFALIASSASKYGTSLIGISLMYILIAWGIGIFSMLLVMFLPVCIFRRISPGRYFKAMLKVWAVSLSTCSSVATLPVTMRVCKEDFDVPDSVTSVVVPLGCTIHMCGGAVSFCLLALFTMQSAGITASVGTFFVMLLLAEILNMAAPGIPGGGIALGAAYLTSLGLPLGFIGIYSGIYRFLDMIYTTLNVSGDVTANILLSGSHTEDLPDA